MPMNLHGLTHVVHELGDKPNSIPFTNIVLSCVGTIYFHDIIFNKSSTSILYFIFSVFFSCIDWEMIPKGSNLLSVIDALLCNVLSLRICLH